MQNHDFLDQTKIADSDFLNDPLCDAADEAFRLLAHVSMYLDTEYGKGYSTKHPQVVASLTQSASMFHLADRLDKLFKTQKP